jgi:hypothetical protein
VGIHNAWDAVTYMALRKTSGPEGEKEQSESTRPGAREKP